MSDQEKATIRLERMYGYGAIYLNVPFTRSMTSHTHRMQAILGRWRDIGVGNSEEEAREAAAEALIERISESRTPGRGRNLDLRKYNDQLTRQLRKLQLAIKELGVVTIAKIMDKIRGNEEKLSPFNTIELEFEIIEVLATFGMSMKTQKFQRQKEVGVAITVDSESHTAETILEFNEDEKLAELAALLNVLYLAQGRLGIQIREMVQVEELIKNQEEKEKERGVPKWRKSQGQWKKSRG